MLFNFNDAHYGFLEKEFGFDKVAVTKMSNDELDSLYNEICEIEIEEACKTLDGAKLFPRGETAVEIVNIMAKALGYEQEDWDDEEWVEMFGNKEKQEDTERPPQNRRA